MMLKNVMWNIFQDTGRIDAYLFYRNCTEDQQENELSSLTANEAGVKK